MRKYRCPYGAIRCLAYGAQGPQGSCAPIGSMQAPGAAPGCRAQLLKRAAVCGYPVTRASAACGQRQVSGWRTSQGQGPRTAAVIQLGLHRDLI